MFLDSFKQILESENLFADSFATHLLASCNCANRNQIRQAYDHLNKSSSNNFWVKLLSILKSRLYNFKTNWTVKITKYNLDNL